MRLGLRSAVGIDVFTGIYTNTDCMRIGDNTKNLSKLLLVLPSDQPPPGTPLGVSHMKVHKGSMPTMCL